MRTAQTNYVDRQVGRRVRVLRDLAKVSVADAALVAGESIEGFRKLEAGECRFAASQLVALAKMLGVRAAAFFDEFSEFDQPEKHTESNIVPLFTLH